MKHLMILVLIAIALGLAGCDQLVGKTENQTVNYAQTVVFDSAGEPVQVLSSDGTYYVSVYEASNDLLIERGLIRIDGRVQPVEVE